MTYMYMHGYISTLYPAAFLDFVYMSSYSTIDSGDEDYSGPITPDTFLLFGNFNVSSVYVSIYTCTCPIVSLFMRCTMRCEIWAHPSELPW